MNVRYHEDADLYSIGSLTIQWVLALAWIALALVSLFAVLDAVLLVIAASALAMNTLWRGMDKGNIPFSEIAIGVNVAQLIVAPYLSFLFGAPSARYAMAVEMTVFYDYVYPAVCVLSAGLSLFSVPSQAPGEETDEAVPKWAASLAWLLLIVGYGSEWLGQQTRSLAFMFFLVSQLRYVAVMVALRYSIPNRRLIVILGVAPLLIASGKIAMFHDFIIWMAFMLLYWYGSRARSFHFKWAVLCLCILGITVVQLIKIDYRRLIRERSDEGYLTLMVEALADLPSASQSDWLSLVNRFNQGWIVSNVLKHIPESKAFVEGRSVRDAVVGALLPRELARNKVVAGGRDLFREFTGLQIGNSTSMGIGVIGEVYGNFGKVRGILFMGAFGLVFGGLIAALHRAGARNPLWIYLSPIVIYQAVKAETDLGVVLNQLSKGLMVALVLHIILRQVVKVENRKLARDPSTLE